MTEYGLAKNAMIIIGLAGVCFVNFGYAVLEEPYGPTQTLMFQRWRLRKKMRVCKVTGNRNY